MIVDCAVYVDGLRRPGAVSPAEALAVARREPRAWAWVGVRDPSGGELDEIARVYGLHPLAVEDAVNAHQRPKLEWHDAVLSMVIKPVAYVDSNEVLSFGEVMVFLGPRFVVTVRHGPVGDLGPVRRRLDADHVLSGYGAHVVLYAVADQIVDDYAAALEAFDDDVERIESEVFSPHTRDVSQRIYQLKRELGEFRRAVIPLGAALERLSVGAPELIPAEALPYFRDVYDHHQRLSDAVETYERQLADVLAANLTQVSLRQNVDQRKISAWAAMALAPTLIAGIYGMNFEVMPELTWRYGYPYALSLMVLVSGLLYRGFRRNHWL